MLDDTSTQPNLLPKAKTSKPFTPIEPADHELLITKEDIHLPARANIVLNVVNVVDVVVIKVKNYLITQFFFLGIRAIISRNINGNIGRPLNGVSQRRNVSQKGLCELAIMFVLVEIKEEAKPQPR